ncbi:GNAT family N-acetyltransferase [Paracoccus sp. PAR01]|uniref:GNAT family N-acetyltransferase n=1 Tax=Paracoccus sp. PAR01 TaxID=2769282 RepID=UPI0017828F94|nr:GNAT family N-acetyltransferase [Paracoccus sp. PAR01]MBD9527237.1 GNAT family N-acetyltransferase [Paracoccus sp. PAR01]
MSATYRNMTRDDLALVLDWAAAEGWNPGRDDAAAFLAADPKGFFMASIDQTPVAAISVVNHGPGFAFLGLYLCRPEFRGQGIGFGLWRHAMEHAGHRTVGLDGVAAQQANYARSGFTLAGSTTRYLGALAAAPDDNIRPLRAEDVPAIYALDTAANGYTRPDFLSAWLTASDSRLTVIAEDAEHPIGFATIRQCREGVKIGPIIAPDADTALRLARAALVQCPAPVVAIDLPESAGNFRARLLAAGLSPGFATARMYRGPAPATSAQLHAIASMELG